MIRRVCFIINKYPNKVEPNVCVFIQQLIWSIADLGVECEVIVPMPINFNKEYIKFPDSRIEINENGNEIKIYHPKYISMGQQGSFMQKARVSFTTGAYERAVDSILSRMQIKPDALYAHFLCPSGVVAARLGKKYGIPSYMAHGEAFYSGDERYGNARLKKELENLNGIIAVSSQNMNYCINAGIISRQRIQVFPNGFREERFYKRDRGEARKRMGWSSSSFIVGFCGSFDERKGINRLENAVNKTSDIFVAYAGKGSYVPHGEKCIMAKQINNEELPWFYSAIDVLVMPTRNEGCCNAIVEAIACGCPIISSNRAFNYDICDESNSILVDPDSIEDIVKAIEQIYADEAKRKALSKGSIEKAKSLTLRSRAQRILQFMEEQR